MKKQICWLLALAMLFSLAGCSAKPREENGGFTASCIGCKNIFPKEQIDQTLKLCPECMLKAGATHCQSCQKACYIQDMILGRCPECANAGQSTTPAQSGEAAAQTVTCQYCGFGVLAQYMIGEYCAGCYSIRQGMCLRCTRAAHGSEGSHCEHCRDNWFYCAKCDNRTPGSEMFLDVCLDCYWRDNSVLVPCPLCGKSISPWEVKGGYCASCYGQANYHEQEETAPPATSRPSVQETSPKCKDCGGKIDDDYYGDRCSSCFYSYCERNDLCISCAKRPNEGMGPSGMECSECYYEDFGTCRECGYDYWKEDMYGDYCYHCYNDVVACENCSDYNSYGWEMVDGYCTICQIDPYSDCAHCGVSFLIRDLSLGLCEDCRKLCNYCWVSRHDGIYEDDYVLCTNCFFELYCYCNGCGEIFAIEDLTDRYCQECYPRHQGQTGGMEE